MNYHDAKLLKAEGDSVLLRTYEGEKRISISRIQYVSYFDDAKLTWDIPQMAEEFASILSEREKAQFAEKSVPELAGIYFDMIVNRYILFREEHGLVGGYEFSDEERRQMAMNAVEKIIDMIKNPPV